MKMICVNNEDEDEDINLTIGKEYECLDSYYYGNYSFEIIICKLVNDIGKWIVCPKNYFITLEEYRNQKLEELGI